MMGPLVQEAAAKPERVQAERINWAENPAVKQLLDALVTIIAAEYVQTVMDKGSDPYHVMHPDDVAFKPYYVAHSRIQTLALLDERFKGSNWWQWRRR